MEVVDAIVDIDEVRAARYAPSRGLQAVACPQYERIAVDHELSNMEDDLNPDIIPSTPRDLKVHGPEEESE